MKLTLYPGASNDAYIKRMFSWLSRIGACPKFGSRPIGWHQSHAMAALSHLEKLGQVPIRCKAGMIQHYQFGKWIDFISARELFSLSDIKARSI